MTDINTLFRADLNDRNEMLRVHLGHHIDEVADWAERPSHMLDGLDRDLCADLIRMRAYEASGCPDMAATVAETISTIVPLAHGLAEVDTAISACINWFSMLMADRNLAKIIAIKEAAAEDRLLDHDPSTMDEETRKAWYAAVSILQQHVDLAELSVVLGGHEIVITADVDGIDVLVQETPGGEDHLALYRLTYPTDDGDDGRWRDPDPEDAPRPDAPVGVDA